MELLFFPFSLSLSLSLFCSPSPPFSPSLFLFFLIHPHSFLLFALLLISFSFSFFSFPFSFSLFSVSLVFLFLFLLLLASPTSMDQVGETSPHFPPWPLVITMFFFLILFISYFPFITSCNTWLNVSHLSQVLHMTLAMCHSHRVPCSILMTMPCVTRHPMPRKT